MSNKLLLPNSMKRIGWIVLVPSFLAGILVITNVIDGNLLNANVPAFFNDPILGESSLFAIIKTDTLLTIIGSFCIIGGLLVGFSKEKQEDEYIQEMRLSSLLWAVWVNYVLLLIAFLFIYGTSFVSVMMYNMFTVLIIFICRFHYLLIHSSKEIYHEKQH